MATLPDIEFEEQLELHNPGPGGQLTHSLR